MAQDNSEQNLSKLAGLHMVCLHFDGIAIMVGAHYSSPHSQSGHPKHHHLQDPVFIIIVVHALCSKFLI